MTDHPHIEPVDETSTEPTTDLTEPTEKPVATPEPTVGTGTAMALGCVAGTIVLIGFGLLFIFFATMR